MKNSRNTTSRIGTRLISRLTKTFCELIFVSNGWPFWSSTSPTRSTSPVGYAEVILLCPSTLFFRVMSMVCSRSLTVAVS